MIIVDDISFVKRNIDEIKKIVAYEGGPVVPLSDPVLLLLRSKGIECMDYHDLESAGMYEDVYATARDWGLRWYKPEGTDLSEFGTYSPGALLEWSMIFFFSHVLKVYLVLSELIKRGDARKIVCIAANDFDLKKCSIKLQNIDAGLLGHIVREVSGEAQQPVEFKLVKLPYPNELEERKFHFVRSAGNYVNLLVSGVCSFFERFFRENRKILFLEGAHHFFEIMKSPSLKKIKKVHFEKNVGLSLFPKMYSNGIRIVTHDNRKPKTPEKGNCFSPDKIDNVLSGFFMYRGKDIFSLVSPRLKFMFEDYFPNVVFSDIIAVEKMLKAESPDLIVTENDTTYFEKMLTVIAKRLSIRTAVVQHGATLCEDACDNKGIMVHDFYPLTADMFFAFGKTTKDWFTKMKVDPGRVIVTGGARFDEYYRDKVLVKDKRNKARKVALILLSDMWLKEGVVTHYAGMTIFHKHIQEFMKLAEKNPDIDFIIRPHDNTHLWSEVFRKELGVLNNITISRESGLKDLFSRVDIVIGYWSTALFEALIYDIPVISLDTGEYYNLLPLWRYELSERVGSFEELESALRKFIHNRVERELFIKETSEKLHLFNYDNDGRAAQRIADGLGEVISKPKPLKRCAL